MTTVEIDGSLDDPLDGGRCAGPPERHLPPRLRHWRQRTSTRLLVIGIGTLPLLLLELVRDDLGYRDRVFLDVADVGVLALFLLDYLIELSLARGHRREFVRAEWAQALIVLAQIAALAPMLAGAGAVRAVRGARALRGIAAILRALALGGAVAPTDDEHSAATPQASPWRSPASHGSARRWASRWWRTSGRRASGPRSSMRCGSTCTITTVGYGDVYPVTSTGRLIGMFTMVVGVTTFAVVTARVAEFLVRATPHDPPTP